MVEAGTLTAKYRDGGGIVHEIATRCSRQLPTIGASTAAPLIPTPNRCRVGRTLSLSLSRARVGGGGFGRAPLGHTPGERCGGGLVQRHT